MCFVVESLAGNNLDLLCIAETWLLPSDITIISAALSSSYSFHHVPRSMDVRGEGVGLIYSRALSNVRVVPTQELQGSRTREHQPLKVAMSFVG